VDIEESDDAYVVEAVAGGVAGETPRDLRSWVGACVDAATASDPWLSEHPPKLTWPLELDGAGGRPVRRSGARGRPPPVEPFLGGSDLRFVTAEFGIPAVHMGTGDMLAGHGYDESSKYSSWRV
jgi:acetylornithine deacetylase